jgi:hypothetical protein
MPDLGRHVAAETRQGKLARFFWQSLDRVCVGTATMASILEHLRLFSDLRVPPSEPNEEDLWRKEFEYAGHGAVKRIVAGNNDWSEARRQFAARWLREKDHEIARREKQLHLDTVRIDTDLDELRDDVTRLQTDVAKMQEDTAQMRADSVRMQEDSVRMQKDTARTQEGASRLQEDNARIQRHVRRMSWGVIAATTIAALSLSASISHWYGAPRWDARATDFLLSAGTPGAGMATAEPSKLEQHEPTQPMSKRGKRRVERFFALRSGQGI